MDDKLRRLLELVKRSPSDAEGWIKVSRPVWPLLDDIPEDLIVRRKADDGGGHIRLTERGVAVTDYL